MKLWSLVVRVSVELKGDRELCLAAVAQRGSAFRSVSEKVKSSRFPFSSKKKAASIYAMIQKNGGLFLASIRMKQGKTPPKAKEDTKIRQNNPQVSWSHGENRKNLSLCALAVREHY